MICPGKTSETHYNKLASLNLEDYVLVSINFEYKLHPVDYLFVGNSRRMKEIRKDLYKKVIASSNVPSGNVFAKINYSSLLNKTEYVKDNSFFNFFISNFTPRLICSAISSSKTNIKSSEI